jgi:malate synthase
VEFRSEDFTIQVHAPSSAAAAELLTPDALRFVGVLCLKFDARRQAPLAARKTQAISTILAMFLSGEQSSRGDPTWRCAPVPDDIKDRRVEITGPDRKW